MNPETRETWRKISAFEIDAPGADQPFSRKLAREQDWSAAYTVRAIEEYRRFLLLGVAAGHPVSPSDTVDQVWHLHLTYTKSYWDGLCKGVLGRPFHHMPSEGRPGEGEKYADWYRQTLASYVRLFGEAPPADIWPHPVEGRPGVGARRAPQHRRVDLGRHWVIPRPRQLLWWSAVGAAVVGFMFAGGCQEQFIQGSVLDLPGPAFLKFYAVISGGVFVLAWWIRFRLRGPHDAEGRVPDDSYAWAYLAGGLQRATMAALSSLLNQKLITVGAGGKLATTGRVAGELHPFENGLLEAVRGGWDGQSKVLSYMDAVGAPIVAELQREGLVVDDAQRSRALWRPLLLSLVPVLLGVAKVVVGLQRDRPVGFLVVLSVGCAMIALTVFRRPIWRTRRGDQTLDQLCEKNSDLKWSMPASVGGTGWAAASVALFGTSVLAGTALASVHEFRRPLGGDTSVVAGGCGSSCGGGDGGGGGGCGGCGGD